jgi:large conductance mechanosensitive channel
MLHEFAAANGDSSIPVSHGFNQTNCGRGPALGAADVILARRVGPRPSYPARNEDYPPMSLIKDFKDFAIKGNVVDLAVGVIIGAAFGKIVSSFVADVVMPPLGLLTSGADFKDLAWTLREAVDKQPAVVLRYGMFLQSVFDFFLVALVIFAVIQAISKLKRAQAVAAAVAPLRQEVLLEQILEAIKAQNKEPLLPEHRVG